MHWSIYLFIKSTHKNNNKSRIWGGFFFNYSLNPYRHIRNICYMIAPMRKGPYGNFPKTERYDVPNRKMLTELGNSFYSTCVYYWILQSPFIVHFLYLLNMITNKNIFIYFFNSIFFIHFEFMWSAPVFFPDRRLERTTTLY